MHNTFALKYNYVTCGLYEDYMRITDAKDLKFQDRGEQLTNYATLLILYFLFILA